jgi:hypothetical protein
VGPIAVTVSTVLAMVCGALLAWLIPVVVQGGDSDDSGVSTQVTFAFMVLGWGPLMAYQFGNIGALSAFHLGSDPPSLLGKLANAGEITLLPIAQIAVLVFAAAMAAITLWRIGVHAEKDGEHIAWGGRFLIFVGSVAYVAISLTIILQS